MLEYRVILDSRNGTMIRGIMVRGIMVRVEGLIIASPEIKSNRQGADRFEVSCDRHMQIYTLRFLLRV